MAKRSTQVPGRVLGAALLGGCFLIGAPARADVDLVFGIYAAEQPVAMMWQCGRLVEAMERHMSLGLDESVAIDIEVNQNFDDGVEDVTVGHVDFARFPNVERHWVIHPDVPERVVEAWRAAYADLDFERLPYMVDAHVFIEGDTGHCQALEQEVAAERIYGVAGY